MNGIFDLILGLILFDVIVLTISYTSVHFIKPRWEEWWERWIAAPHPDESGLGEDFPLI